MKIIRICFIQYVQEHIDDWGVLYIPECDADRQHRIPCNRYAHAVHRHWPGDGSFAMSSIIHNRLRRFVRKVVCHGRCMRVYLFDGCTVHISCVCIHGGHGEALLGSLADASLLIRSRPSGSRILMIGDQNVDQLPLDAVDFWRNFHD